MNLVAIYDEAIIRVVGIKTEYAFMRLYINYHLRKASRNSMCNQKL